MDKYLEKIAISLKNRAYAINYSSATEEQKFYALFELRNLMYNLADEFTSNISIKEKFFKSCDIQFVFEAYMSKELKGEIRTSTLNKREVLKER